LFIWGKLGGMKSQTYRLDRFISKHSPHTLAEVKLLVAQKRVLLNGIPAQSVRQTVGQFTHVVCDDVCMQNQKPVYLMLNKPKGVVSATRDAKHKTVLDLVDHSQHDELHIAGRLDLNSTGLLLLTNDGAWSRAISHPDSKLEKVYEVVLENTIDDSYIEAFKQGMHFKYEDVITKPAKLEILDARFAKVSLVEGKYHQIKRMFGAFQNRVLELHRTSVGQIELDETLNLGESRELTDQETRF
jgi:16S rRNA pseudouridine516 synthase